MKYFPFRGLDIKEGRQLQNHVSAMIEIPNAYILRLKMSHLPVSRTRMVRESGINQGWCCKITHSDEGYLESIGQFMNHLFLVKA